MTPLRALCLLIIASALVLSAAQVMRASPLFPSAPETGETPRTRAPLPPLAALDANQRRPLFEASRRPLPAPEAQPHPENALILGRYALIGVLSVGGQPKVALRRAEDGAILRLTDGDRLDGWQVHDVTMDGFRLARNGKALAFSFDESPATQ